MLVEYVRDRKNSKIVDERVEVVHKKNEKGKEKEIKELWVKLEKGCPIGVVVSTGHGTVGWSLLRKGDTFSKKRAIKIALGREQYFETLKEKDFYYGNKGHRIPTKIISFLDKMNERSKKAFKEQ